jgi:multidrug efflux pump subunit AcrA (membrane-fusion protein)
MRMSLLPKLHWRELRLITNRREPTPTASPRSRRAATPRRAKPNRRAPPPKPTPQSCWPLANRSKLHAVRSPPQKPTWTTRRFAQALSIEQQIHQAQADIQSAEAEVARSRAQLQEAEANRSDLRIVAPFDGTVATRSTEPGEVVAPGTAIVTILNPGQIYLRAFIPEGEIGRVRTGQPARVYLDSNPKQPLEAVVARVDPQASFTPENTYFRDDRVKQVVGVKLQLVNPQGFAKPGMPADGEVLVEGHQWMATNR